MTEVLTAIAEWTGRGERAALATVLVAARHGREGGRLANRGGSIHEVAA